MAIIPSDEFRKEISEKGQKLYADKLEALLEPEHHNEYVAIHVDTGDYEIGRTFTQALRKLTDRLGVDGRVMTRRIGNEVDYGLASRVLAAETGRPLYK